MTPADWLHAYTAAIGLWCLSVSTGKGWQLALYRAALALLTLVHLAPLLRLMGAL